jgi:hypothetical protein
MANGQTSENGSRMNARAQAVVAVVAVASMCISLVLNYAASRPRVDAIEARVTALEKKQETLANFREEVLSRLARIETMLSERMSYEPTYGEAERN